MVSHMATNQIAAPKDPSAPFSKRLFDLFFSSCFLFFASPLYLLLILLVKATSKGPVFFRSVRMGQNGKLITCYKFRTMELDAQAKLQSVLASDPKLQEEWNTYHKLKKDPRLTPIGSFLRKSSLDELPQFWNVIVGDLSVVGPRPIEVLDQDHASLEIRNRYREKTDRILSAKPGITCLWQVRGRNALTFDERAEMELEYVERQSFWLDLKIICQTVGVLLFPKGAY